MGEVSKGLTSIVFSESDLSLIKMLQDARFGLLSVLDIKYKIIFGKYLIVRHVPNRVDRSIQHHLILIKMLGYAKFRETLTLIYDATG